MITQTDISELSGDVFLKFAKYYKEKSPDIARQLAIAAFGYYKQSKNELAMDNCREYFQNEEDEKTSIDAQIFALPTALDATRINFPKKKLKEIIEQKLIAILYSYGKNN